MAIVGAGLIGARRAQVAAAAGDRIVVVADVDQGRAAQLAQQFGAASTVDWRDAVAAPGVDAVCVAVLHRDLSPITHSALSAGRHVLVEKPVGRSPAEIEPLVEIARRNRLVLAAGYNHRLHPGVAHAHELAASGVLGPLIVLRCRYGHGGRPGYDREWRADPVLAGGGELMDQGMHALDLFTWFAGDFNDVQATMTTAFWDMPVEDNAFAILRTAAGTVATLHTSWTQWKNLFSLEVFGRDGYVVTEGLGGSYGPERLVAGRRRPEGGPPEIIEEIEYPARDESWTEEWRLFRNAVRGQGVPSVTGEDALRTSRLAARVYAAAGKAPTA